MTSALKSFKPTLQNPSLKQLLTMNFSYSKKIFITGDRLMNEIWNDRFKLSSDRLFTREKKKMSLGKKHRLRNWQVKSMTRNFWNLGPWSFTWLTEPDAFQNSEFSGFGKARHLVVPVWSRAACTSPPLSSMIHVLCHTEEETETTAASW